MYVNQCLFDRLEQLVTALECGVPISNRRLKNIREQLDKAKYTHDEKAVNGDCAC